MRTTRSAPPRLPWIACAFAFAAGIWMLLGLCLADSALQQACGWSPAGTAVADPQETQYFEDGKHRSVTSRGTTPALRDFEADLALALNVGFPFEALGMKPLVPLRLSVDIPDKRVHDPKHAGLVLAWLCLPPALWLLSTLRRRRGLWKSRVLCVATLAILAGGAFVGSKLVPQLAGAERANAGGWQAAMGYGMTAVLALAGALCLVALLGSFWLGVGFRRNIPRAGKILHGLRLSTRAWFAAAVAASALGLFMKAALWLGWYTNDTRVNLVEPLAILAPRYGAALALIGVVWAVLLWKWRPRRLRREVSGIAVAFAAVTLAIAHLAPDPPRIGSFVGDGHYVLTTENELISYGDWEASVRSGPSLLSLRMRDGADKVVSEAKETSAAILAYGKGWGEKHGIRLAVFNSAFIYITLVDQPWLQLALFVGAVLALGATAVCFAACAGLIVGAAVRLLAFGSWLGRVALLLQLGALAGLAWMLVRFQSEAIQSHSMVRVLVHTRGEIVAAALDSLVAYEKSRADRRRWEAVAEAYSGFEAEFQRNAEMEADYLRRIETYGASDDLAFATDADLLHRIALVSAARSSRACLVALCEGFPDELERRLTMNGIPEDAVRLAVASWERELVPMRAPSLARMQRLNAELDLLRWLAANREAWKAGRPGAFPAFEDKAALSDFLRRVDGILEAKQTELERMQDMKSRLTWLDRGFAEKAEVASRFLLLQREFAACFKDPAGFDIDRKSTGPRFKSEAVKTKYDGLLSQLKVMGFPASRTAPLEEDFVRARDAVFEALRSQNAGDLLRLFSGDIHASAEGESVEQALGEILSVFKGREPAEWQPTAAEQQDEVGRQLRVYRGRSRRNGEDLPFKVVLRAENGQVVVADISGDE